MTSRLLDSHVTLRYTIASERSGCFKKVTDLRQRIDPARSRSFDYPQGPMQGKYIGLTDRTRLPGRAILQSGL